MEFLVQYTGLVEFDPAESFLLSFLVEADPLSTPRIHDGSPVDHALLVPVEMARREELVVSGDGGFSDMSLLSEVALKPFDRIVCEEYVHVSLARQFLSGQRVLFRTESGAETHPGDIDRLASEMEHLRGWPRVLQEVDVSRFRMNG